MEDITSDSNMMRRQSTRKESTLPAVELHIHPPLSYKMTTKKVGPLILVTPIEQGDTLVDLLLRLFNDDQKVWKELFNAQKKKMRPPIRTILNGKALSPSALAHATLSDGDQISFVLIYGGG